MPVESTRDVAVLQSPSSVRTKAVMTGWWKNRGVAASVNPERQELVDGQGRRARVGLGARFRVSTTGGFDSFRRTLLSLRIRARGRLLLQLACGEPKYTGVSYPGSSCRLPTLLHGAAVITDVASRELDRLMVLPRRHRRRDAVDPHTTGKTVPGRFHGKQSFGAPRLQRTARKSGRHSTPVRPRCSWSSRTISGSTPVWLHLTIAHALHGKSRKLVYRFPALAM